MSNAMTPEQMQAMILKLTQENESLKKAQQAKLRLKVSEKGGVSLYGMGRFPLTLYKSQWLALLDNIPTIKAFIEANDSILTNKES